MAHNITIITCDVTTRFINIIKKNKATEIRKSHTNIIKLKSGIYLMRATINCNVR